MQLIIIISDLLKIINIKKCRIINVFGSNTNLSIINNNYNIKK